MTPEETLIFRPHSDGLAQPDPLMQQTVDFIRTWHHGRDADADQDSKASSSQFEKKLQAFGTMWTGSYSGLPVHNCSPGCCASREDAVAKMASTFIALLLTALPTVPSPNKWTKVFGISDFVALGTLINRFLPNLFEIAFHPLMFTTETGHEEADPRLVEGLFFHAVQGKRFHSSKEFLQDSAAQWTCRCWLLISEHLRRLVFYWLRNLKPDKQVARRFPICQLLDPRSSVVWAVLQNLSHQLLDETGGGRLCMIWQVSGFESYQRWCQHASQEVRDLRRAMLALSAWVYRRHVSYWEDFPWCLMKLIDPEASEDAVKEVLLRWDMSAACCVPAGMALSLKKLAVSSQALWTEQRWRMLLTGVGRLLQMSIADVECKHALSRHWADRPFPTLTAKHVNQEAKVSVQEAIAQAEFLRLTSSVSSASSQPSRGQQGLVSLRQKQIRSKSAYMYFRDDLLSAFAAQHGGVVNPCTKEFWEDLRVRWQALGPDQRAYYEEKAQQSKHDAQCERQRKRAQCQAIAEDSGQAAAASAPRASLASRPDSLQPLQLTSGDGEERSVSYNPWLVAGEAWGATDIAELASTVAARAQAPQGDVVDLADECVQRSPISQKQLISWWQGSLKNGHTWAQCLHQYNCESQRFAVPAAGAAFPAQVTYQSCCGVFCRQRESPQDVLLYMRLLQAFSAAVAQCGTNGVASACKTDILLQVSIGREDIHDLSCEYVWMTACSARSGVHPPSQMFLALDVTDAVLEGSLVRLRLRSGEPLQSQVPWCSSVLDRGPLVHSTEQLYAKSLVESLRRMGGDAVRIARMTFTDVNLSTVEATGVAPGWEQIVVRAAPETRKPEPVHPQPPVEDGASAAAAAGFDLLEEVMQGPAAPRARGRGQGRGQRTSSALREVVVAALPLDASLQQSLDAELACLLKEENVLPPEETRQGHDAQLLGRALEDPVTAASLGEDSRRSFIQAVEVCQRAEISVEAAFAESDDDEVEGEAVDADGYEDGDDAAAAASSSASVAVPAGLPDDAVECGDAALTSRVPRPVVVYRLVMGIFLELCAERSGVS